MSILLNGALLGIILSLMLGPAFFVLLETSLKYGFKRAFFLDLGILISDLLYLLAAYFFAEQIEEALKENAYLKYIGGSLLIAGGLYMIFRKNNIPTKKEVELEINQPGLFAFTMKGMALNAINPFLLIFWIAAFSYAIENHNLSGYTIWTYFGATLGAMMAIDLLKIYFAYKVKKYLSDKVIRRIGIAVGIALIFFGTAFFFREIPAM